MLSDKEKLRRIDLLEDAVAAWGSAAKLAVGLGVTKVQVSHWRSGTRPVPDKHLMTLASILGVDPALGLAREEREAARQLVLEATDGYGRTSELARRLGVSPARVSNWKVDLEPVPAKYLENIQHFLDE